MPYKTKTASMPMALATGSLAAWGITLAMAALTAFLVASERIEETWIAPLSVVSVLLATLGGTMLAARCYGSKRMIVCLAESGLYFVGLLCCNAVFFGAAYQGFVPAMLMIFGVGVIAGLVGMRKKGNKYARFRKRF